MIKDLSIRNKIVLLLVFPVLGLILSAVFNISSKWDQQQRIKETQQLVNLSGVLDQLAPKYGCCTW